MNLSRHFYQSYLIAYIFWFGISFGALTLLMLHHLVGGRWGYIIRRPLEAAVSLLPTMMLLFVPVLIGLGHIYPWASHPSAIHLHRYLGRPFFALRALLCFTMWIYLAKRLISMSIRQDSDSSLRTLDQLKRLSAGGLVLIFFTSLVVFTDWLMSLEPGWYSTIYSLMVLTGQTLAALALMIVVAYPKRVAPVIGELVQRGGFYDLGNMLFAFTLLWIYMAFSQYLLIWSGNLMDEIHWYLARQRGGWGGLAIFMVTFHFFVPFFILLARGVKRRPSGVAAVAALIVVMHGIDVVWLIQPAFTPGDFHLSLFVSILVVMGIIWGWFFNRSLRSRPAIPHEDPRLKELFAHGAA